MFVFLYIPTFYISVRCTKGLLFQQCGHDINFPVATSTQIIFLKNLGGNIIVQCTPVSIECFYRGPGCLVVECLAPSPPLPPLLSVTDRRHTGRLRKRDSFLTGEEGLAGEEQNSKSYQNQESLVLYESIVTLWCNLITSFG